MNQDNQEYFNFLNALGVVLGVLNLIQNDKQSAYNDVHKANDEQAEMLLAEINKKFNEQNEILAKQNEILYNLLNKIDKELGD